MGELSMAVQIYKSSDLASTVPAQATQAPLLLGMLSFPILPGLKQEQKT